MSFPDNDTYTCQNCGRKFENITDLEQMTDAHLRLEPGDPYPAGECPDCGAVVHVDDPDWRHIVEDILEHTDILPTLIGINGELDSLIEQEMKK